MTRSAQKKEVSRLISGGIFSQRVGKTSKAKPEANFKGIVEDLGGLLEGFMGTFTATVDNAFPNANFLSESKAKTPTLSEIPKQKPETRTMAEVLQQEPKATTMGMK